MELKLDILAFGAHPDDVELGAGASVYKHVQQGFKVGIVDLTLGQLGSRGTVADRLEEAAASAKILGLSVRENLEMEDGFFLNDQTHRLKVIRAIRKYKPEIVWANAPSDRHPDHAKASALVSEACFSSGLSALKTELNGEPQTHWRPKVVYHYIQDRYLKPDVVVDITGFFDKKMEAVKAFKTQFFDPANPAPNTPISSKEFILFLEARAREYGRIIGTEFGEGFITERSPGIDNFSKLI
jgi:N-acetylglucosamine malate deacetylase 1